MKINVDTASPEARARYQALWHTLPPTAEQIAAQKPRVYVDGTRTLESYATAQPRSKYEQTTTESDANYVSRMTMSVRHALSEQLAGTEELERIAASYEAAVARLSSGSTDHGALREHLSSATGVGILGQAQTHQPQPAAPGRPMSTIEAMAIAREREQAQRGLQPARQDVGSLRSTGAGILGVG